MSDGSFLANERSLTLDKNNTLKITFTGKDDASKTLKDGIAVLDGDVIDATFMDVAKLQAFLRQQLAKAKQDGVLFSLHMKATMMKVSDPIIFGYTVKVLLGDVFEKYGDALTKAGADPDKGLASVYGAVEKLDGGLKSEVEAAIQAAIENGPDLAMVNSDKGITGLHVSSDIIIDASMPPMIRDSGKMWNPAGELQDTLAVIPEPSYSSVYAEVVEDCKVNGAYDPATMGNVPNVGLMAYKAEEYGSHPYTFTAPGKGVIRVEDQSGAALLEHQVSEGDIWRMCRTQDIAVRDWVKLAVARARATDTPAIFWLNKERAHDAELIKKVQRYLPTHDIAGLEIGILSPLEATRQTVQRMRQGQDTISVTGNVLRDYLTDLFPILEVGTSAKMLSVVPLLNGGVLLETGAGGSAPKHVQQMEAEGHLRWDSLGEFLALAEAFRHVGQRDSNAKAKILADTLDEAISQVLDNGKSPSRKVNEIDNRGSHFYLALYWAQALAGQSEDAELRAKFVPLAEQLTANEKTIDAELLAAQGSSVDLGGYYLPGDAELETAMRPSKTFNAAIEEFASSV
jgi:isocitrate dehydrogenase